MAASFTESAVENAVLAWLESLSYTVLHGPDIAAGEPGAERIDPKYQDVVIEDRLRQALVRFSLTLPDYVPDNSYRKVTLAALRDTLLPRLISGDLRVKDAERILERCM